jgi:hypothetical protein
MANVCEIHLANRFEGISVATKPWCKICIAHVTGRMLSATAFNVADGHRRRLRVRFPTSRAVNRRIDREAGDRLALENKGIGRIYQQIFVETYPKVAHANLCTTKTPLAADFLTKDSCKRSRFR